MIIHTKKIKFDIDEISYKDTNIVTCCGRMENSTSIELNDSYDKIAEEDNYSVKLIETTVYGDYNGGYDTDYEYCRINHCPFCGNEIIIEVIETLDKTDEFNQLNEERENVWNKCKKTDSKKKEQEFLKLRDELDRKIESFYHSDGFKML